MFFVDDLLPGVAGSMLRSMVKCKGFFNVIFSQIIWLKLNKSTFPVLTVRLLSHTSVCNYVN